MSNIIWIVIMLLLGVFTVAELEVDETTGPVVVEEDETIEEDDFVIADYDEGTFSVGETIIVKGQDETARMAFTVTNAYRVPAVEGDMEEAIVAIFTIENVSDYSYVPREQFPMFLNINPYDPDYGLVADMDYGMELAPGEMVEGSVSRDFNPDDGVELATLAFNLYPGGALPEEGMMYPAVMQPGDVRLNLTIEELDRIE